MGSCLSCLHYCEGGYESCCALAYTDTAWSKFVNLLSGGAADCHMSVIFQLTGHHCNSSMKLEWLKEGVVSISFHSPRVLSLACHWCSVRFCRVVVDVIQSEGYIISVRDTPGESQCHFLSLPGYSEHQELTL